MKNAVIASLIVTLSIHSQIAAADVVSCSQMLVETPGSVEARVCFAREMSILDDRMKQVVAAIEVEIEKGSVSFKLDEFRSSQLKWEQYVTSTCWLDAAGATNSDAVLQHCSSRYTLQRLSQLQVLHKVLKGEEPVIWPMSNLNYRGEP